MKKTVITILAAVCSLAAQAQNLNQTVSITNAYKTGSEGEEKQYLPVALPDSLTRFDYKFDYSVFDAPYKGAFEFSPYSVNLVPDPSVPETRNLLVRAGAGYGLYPQLQAVWNPVRREISTLNVYQDLHGYVGKYREVSNEVLLPIEGKSYDGLDLAETFGVEVDLRKEKFNAAFDVAYNGIFNKDNHFSGNFFNSVKAGVGVSSGRGYSGKVGYDIALNAEYAVDALDHNFEKNSLSQRGVDLAATVEPRLSDAFGLQIDAGLKYLNYGNAGDFACSYLGYSLAPHVNLTLGPVDLKAGIRIDGTDKMKFAPDVSASILLLDKIKVTAYVSGGTKFNTYADIRRANHWFCPGYSDNLKNTFEQINAGINFEGGIASRLQYSLKAGFASVEDMLLWGVGGVGGKLLPRMKFVGCNYAYGDLALTWKSPRFDADGTLSFRKSNLTGDSSAFEMPLLSGSAKLAYNWNRRIFVGVRMKASMESKLHLDEKKKLPAYVDFGVFGEYGITRHLSVWVRGDNLFNEFIQITPMHIENGISGTVGVTFNL